MSSTNGDGKGNLLLTYLFKGDSPGKHIKEEIHLKNLIAQMMHDEGYHYALVDDDTIQPILIDGGWISTDNEMPKSEQRVLVFYTNECKMPRIELACYIPPHTVRADDFLDEDAEGCSEYFEDEDEYYVVEGWWESSWEADTNWKLSYEPTHWRPLPKIPEVEK